MKRIPTSLHALMDYSSAAIFLAGPWVLLFNHVQMATSVSVAAGLAVALMSMFTRYEGGVVRVVPMRVHLTADVVLGLFLISAPWIFNFAQETYLFHVAMGLTALLSGLYTVPFVKTDALTVQKR